MILGGCSCAYACVIRVNNHKTLQEVKYIFIVQKMSALSLLVTRES